MLKRSHNDLIAQKDYHIKELQSDVKRAKHSQTFEVTFLKEKLKTEQEFNELLRKQALK